MGSKDSSREARRFMEELERELRAHQEEASSLASRWLKEKSRHEDGLQELQLSLLTLTLTLP